MQFARKASGRNHKAGKKCVEARTEPDTIQEMPKISSFLFKIMKSVVSSDKVPLKWRMADGVLIPKVEQPIATEIDGQFRQIALMNVEAKLFWSMISRKFYNHLVKENKFIDAAVQKGAINRTPGCWEHKSMVWTALKDILPNGNGVSIARAFMDDLMLKSVREAQLALARVVTALMKLKPDKSRSVVMVRGRVMRWLEEE